MSEQLNGLAAIMAAKNANSQDAEQQDQEVTESPEVVKAPSVQEDYDGAIYRNIRDVNKLILASGVVVKPVNGKYYPKTEEEVALLDYFVSIHKAEKLQ